MMFQEIDKRAVVSECWDFDLASSTFLIFFFLIKFNTIPKPRKKGSYPTVGMIEGKSRFFFDRTSVFFVGWLVGS